MKPGIDDICITLHQILVGAASSREKKSLYGPYLHNRGWKPLPQSESFKLTNLNFLGSNEVSFLIRLAAFFGQRRCLDETSFFLSAYIPFRDQS
jgi:hypothetical protein